MSAIKTLTDQERTPLQKISAILLLCISMRRPGMSAMNTTASIINENMQFGINPGPNPDGTPNLVNAYTYNITKGIMDDIRKNASVQCVIPVGALNITCTGGNAGGPVTATGSNTLPLTIKGIIG